MSIFSTLSDYGVFLVIAIDDFDKSPGLSRIWMATRSAIAEGDWQSTEQHAQTAVASVNSIRESQ